MSPEDRLAAFLSDDATPARPAVDAVFMAEALQRVARRELGVKLTVGATTALAAGAVLWACSPALNLLVAALAPALAPTAAVLALVATVGLLGDQTLARR